VFSYNQVEQAFRAAIASHPESRTPDAQPSSTDEVERVARVITSMKQSALISRLEVKSWLDELSAAIAAMVTKP
jgi:hypothetical protein